MNICIVEDHLLIAESLKTLLVSEDPDYEIRTYGSAEAFLAAGSGDWLPDMVLMDISLPGMSGMELIDRAIEMIPAVKVILLTSNNDIDVVKSAMKKGIGGYLTKDILMEELKDAINTVREGGRYINRSLKEKIVYSQFNTDGAGINFSLSRRERQVLQKLCEGFTPKEIAGRMDLSVHTINHYLSNMMGKLKVNRTTELVLFAARHGLFVPPGL